VAAGSDVDKTAGVAAGAGVGKPWAETTVTDATAMAAPQNAMASILFIVAFFTGRR
jgi:hypothetical protein